MNETPMIYTSRGNLPIESLEYSTEWEFTENSIVFKEIHKAADGEIVRKAVHIQLLSPQVTKVETERLN